MRTRDSITPKRDPLDAIGLFVGALIIVIVTYGTINSLWPEHRRPDDRLLVTHSDTRPPYVATESATYKHSDERAKRDVFFTGRFDEMLAVNSEERAVLVFRQPKPQSPNVHAYFVVHLDGRAEPEFRLSSRNYTYGTTDSNEVNTDDSRNEIFRLERLAKRFHLEDQWLAFATFSEARADPNSMPYRNTWTIRFNGDGTAEIGEYGKRWRWVRTKGSDQFIADSIDPVSKFLQYEPSQFISYELNTDGYTRNELMDEEPRTCFYWAAPGSNRSKIACGSAKMEAGQPVSCDKGICLLASNYGRDMYIVEERTGHIIASGSVNGSMLVSFAVNDAGQVAISCAGGGGITTVIDLHTGVALDRRNYPDSDAPTMWLDNRTLIAHDSRFSDNASLVRLSLDNGNDFENHRSWQPWQLNNVDGGP